MHQSVLSYGEFVTYIRENVESVLADDRETEVVLSEIAKNNGVMSEIMTIQREGENAAPVFYMRDIYEQYLRGAAADDLIDQIIVICRQCNVYTLLVTGEWFEAFENISDHIILRVVNYEKNRQKLEHCPFIRKLDLALTFRILVEEESSQIGTVLISDDLMRRWKVTASDLYKLAVANMQRLWEGVVEPVQDMIFEMADDQMAEEYGVFLEENEGAREMPLYVLTNAIRLNGASVLFYTDCLKSFADSVGRDIFVLPSSIHEVLLIPVDEDVSAWDMRQVVETVNHQIVSDEEILSNHVYRYLYDSHKLIIAA